MLKSPRYPALARHQRLGLVLAIGFMMLLALLAVSAQAETVPSGTSTAAAKSSAPIRTHTDATAEEAGTFSVPCGRCHDMHQAPYTPLLPAEVPALCGTCHDLTAIHDDPATQQDVAASSADCLSCHTHSSGFMPVSGTVSLTLSKQAVGYDDLDSDGNLSPGDRVHYRVDYANPGPEAVSGVTLRDQPDTAHVATVETITGDGIFDGTAIQWTIGTLEPEANGSVTYDVVLKDATAFTASAANAATMDTSTTATAGTDSSVSTAAPDTSSTTTTASTATTLAPTGGGTDTTSTLTTMTTTPTAASTPTAGPNDVLNTAVLAGDSREPVSASVIVSVVVPSPPPVASRYQQTNTNIVKVGSWADFTTASASGGSYGRASTSGASATVYFSGTRLDWIAMKGTTTGLADVYLDGAFQTTLNLAASVALYQVNLWSTGTLSNGPHNVRIVRNSGSASGKYVTLDAFDIWGTISSPPPVASRYQQTNTNIVKVGSWADFTTASASGGSYGRASTSGASATVYFSGTRLDWIAMKGTTTGLADVYLDGAFQTTLNLAASVALYQVNLWSTGTLSNGPHNVRIVRNSGSASGKYVTLDAFDIWGTISSPASATSETSPTTGSTTTTTTAPPAASSTTTTSLPQSDEVVNSLILNADNRVPVSTSSVVRVVVPGLSAPSPTTTTTEGPATAPDPSALTLSERTVGYDDIDGDGNLSPGDRVHYRIDYGNPGAENVTGVLLRDEPDTHHIASVEAISDGGVFDGKAIEWSIGTLAAGGSGFVTYDVVLKDALAFGGTTTTTTTTPPTTDTSTTTTTSTTEIPTTTVTDPPTTESPTTTTLPSPPGPQTTSVPMALVGAVFGLAGTTKLRLLSRAKARRRGPR